MKFDPAKNDAALALFGAAAIWFGFPNDVLCFPPIVLVWPLALCRLGTRQKNWHPALRKGWLVGLIGNLAALYWLCMPVAQVGGLPWPAALACAALIAFVLAAQSAIFACASFCLKNFCLWRRISALCLCWYLLEYLFAFFPGFPWLPLAGALAQWPIFTQFADICGAYALGALWLAVSLACFCPKEAWRAGGLGVAALLLIYGFWRLQETPFTAWPQGSDTVPAVMVEGNVEQNQKWNPAFQQASLDLYLRLTAKGLRQSQKRFGDEKPLIVWPETAMPFFYERNPLLAGQLARAVKEFGCPLLFGAPGIGGKSSDEIFNRAFLLAPDGSVLSYYDKEHLVPFGEYAPEWLKFDFLEALLQGVGIYSEGESAKPLGYGRLALGLLICYEGIFPWLAQERVAAGASLLVDISNDGWFGQTPAARQHLYLTALRCVEQRRWMLRATNTGISAVIDQRGRMVMTGPMFKAGFLSCRARLLADFTFYHHAAKWLPWFAVVFFFGIVAQGCAKQRKA